MRELRLSNNNTRQGLPEDGKLTDKRRGSPIRRIYTCQFAEFHKATPQLVLFSKVQNYKTF
jgi:hypothetical protein